MSASAIQTVALCRSIDDIRLNRTDLAGLQDLLPQTKDHRHVLELSNTHPLAVRVFSSGIEHDKRGLATVGQQAILCRLLTSVARSALMNVTMEARVDNAGSARDVLIESLGRVRLELTYRAWREAIPDPKRMIIDMIVGQSGYVPLARVHRMHWRTA